MGGAGRAAEAEGARRAVRTGPSYRRNRFTGVPASSLVEMPERRRRAWLSPLIRPRRQVGARHGSKAGGTALAPFRPEASAFRRERTAGDTWCRTMDFT